jgi:hypothetical protein
LTLVAVLVVGFFLFWQYGRNRPRPAAAPAVVGDRPPPVEPDRSVAFESVTDRTPMSLRDNAAYDLLIKRSRERTPEKLAAESRRDVLLTHLWERPSGYRGVPVHIDGNALRALRYESKLSRTGWLYEAWIETPDSGRFPYVCVFEDAPRGFPIGPNIAERVVFNGYFLKIMGYQAADVARGAPVLVGRIGWDASRSADLAAPGSGSTLRWTLIALAVLFVITLVRWIAGLGRLMGRRGGRASGIAAPAPGDEIDPNALAQWVREAGEEDGPAADSGARPPDEAQSSASPTSGV